MVSRDLHIVFDKFDLIVNFRRASLKDMFKSGLYWAVKIKDIKQTEKILEINIRYNPITISKNEAIMIFGAMTEIIYRRSSSQKEIIQAFEEIVNTMT